jgi:microsomal dipeptidase-like Zn-dependent dipeptidase
MTQLVKLFPFLGLLPSFRTAVRGQSTTILAICPTIYWSLLQKAVDETRSCELDREKTMPRMSGVADISSLASPAALLYRGVPFLPDFVGKPADLELVADHIEYISTIAGKSRVGIGSDFDGFPGPGIPGLEDVSHYRSLVSLNAAIATYSSPPLSGVLITNLVLSASLLVAIRHS